MPTLTYTFPIQKIDDENTIQLIMVFEQTFTLSSPSYTAAEKGLRVLEYDKLEMSYDLEDALLVPSKFSLTIGDPQGEFDEIFFGGNGTRGYQTDKQATCTIKVNGINKFIGQIIEDSIELDMATKIIKFDAAPKTDVINKRMVYDDNGNPLNPFGYNLALRYPIAQLLEDIYKLVNPNISFADGTLEIIHDWKFQGQKYYPNDGYENYLNDFEVYEIEPLIRAYYLDNQAGVSTCGDILRELAKVCCAFTGLVSYNKAFFKKLFHYESSNVQVVNVYGWKKGYRYGLIDYVKLNCTFKDINGDLYFDPNEPYEAGTFTELQDRFLSLKSMHVFFRGIASPSTSRNTNIFFGRVDLGHFTNNDYFVFNCTLGINTYPGEGAIYSNNGSEFEIVGTPMTAPDNITSFITTKKISGTSNPTTSGTLTKVSGDGLTSYNYASFSDATGYYNIYQVRDPNIESNVWLNYGDMVAKFWYKYRGNIANCRVDKFIFKGINYDFLKDFNYQGYKFQPIGMAFYYSKGYTECEAIYLGEL